MPSLTSLGVVFDGQQDHRFAVVAVHPPGVEHHDPAAQLGIVLIQLKSVEVAVVRKNAPQEGSQLGAVPDTARQFEQAAAKRIGRDGVEGE